LVLKQLNVKTTFLHDNLRIMSICNNLRGLLNVKEICVSCINHFKASSRVHFMIQEVWWLLAPVGYYDDLMKPTSEEVQDLISICGMHEDFMKIEELCLELRRVSLRSNQWCMQS